MMDQNWNWTWFSSSLWCQKKYI